MDEQENYQTIRIWVKTQRQLKLLAALKHNSMVEVLDQLVKRELERIQGKDAYPHGNEDV